MPKLRFRPSIALSALLLLLPSAPGVTQDDQAFTSPAQEATPSAGDSRLAELEALLPPELAGGPTGGNLHLAGGERLLSLMQPGEAAIVADLLAAHERTAADYAAAAGWLPLSGDQRLAFQVHRIAGVDAIETTSTWTEILSLSLDDPETGQATIAGVPVVVITDGAHPGEPRLHLFAVADMTWMAWSNDESALEEVVGAAAAVGEVAEP